MSVVGYRAVLAQRDFRRLWFGEVTSYLGDWFNTIAVYTLVQSLTSSAQALAAVVVVRTLPNFLMTPVAGPLVDRFDRRSLMLVSDVARALCVLALLLAHRFESLTGVYVSLTVLMLFTGLAEPAKRAALPMVVGAGQIASANALTGGSWSVMLALGAALGGLVTQWLGVTAALLVDAATYLVSFAFIAGLPRLRPPKMGDRKKTFIAGVAYLRRSPGILALTSLKSLMALPMGGVLLIPLYGVAYGGLEVAAFTGTLFAARGFGALLGSLGLRPFVPDRPGIQRAVVVAGLAVLAVGYGVAALAAGYAQVVVGLTVAAVGSGAVWVFSGTLLQQEADPEFHGRVFAIEWGGMTLVASIMSWLAGIWVDSGMPLSQVAGWVAVLAAFAATVAGLALSRSPMPAST